MFLRSIGSLSGVNAGVAKLLDISQRGSLLAPELVLWRSVCLHWKLATLVSPKIVWYRRLPSSRPISANRAMRIIDYCYNDGGGTRKVLNKHRTKLISPRWDWEDTVEVRPRISINRTAVEANRNFLLQPENIAEEIRKPDRRETFAGRYITLTQIRLARGRWNVQGVLLATWKPSKYPKGSTKVNRVLRCWWSANHSRKKSLRMFNL